MRVRLFGPVTVTNNGNRVPLDRPLHQLAMAILASNAGSPLSAEFLINQLWPIEAFEQRASQDPRARLHELISQLRKVLKDAGCEPLDRRRNIGYVLAVDGQAVDVLRFRDRCSRAEEALRRSSDDEAVRLFREALREWDGDDAPLQRPEPFAGLSGDWVDRQRVQLNKHRRTALVLCKEAELRLGRHHELIPELCGLAEEEPFDEAIAALLMRAYYGAGNASEALNVYATIRERLDTDLGTEPGTRLQELHQLVLNHDPQLSLGAPAGAAGTRPSERKQVMTKYVNKVGGHAKVAVVASMIKGNVYTGPQTAEPGLGERLGDLRRKLRAAHRTGKVPALTLSAAEAVLTRAAGQLDDSGDTDDADLTGFVAELEEFQRLVDGVDELVELADELIDRAKGGDR